MNSCRVTVKNGTELNIPVCLRQLNPGMHDIVFLIVCNAKESLTDKERTDTYDFNTVYLRCTIYAGEEKSPVLEAVKGGTEEPLNVENPVSIMLHEDAADVNKLLLNKQVGKGTDFTCYLTVGGEEEEDVALLLLEDWKQKEWDGEEQKMIHLLKNTQQTIPIHLQYPEAGVHEITVLKIRHVYQEYQSEWSEDVESSARLGILSY